MRFVTLILLACLLACLPALSSALDFRNSLGDDQRSETIEIAIDGKSIGTLRVDSKHPSARLKLPLEGDQHRYRLSGTAEMRDGTSFAIAGAGLIVRRAAMDRIAEAKTADAAIAAYTAMVTAMREAAPGLDLDALRITRGAAATEAELKAAEQRLGTPLPSAYRALLLSTGPLRLGTPTDFGGALYAPAQVQTLEQYVLDQARANEASAADLSTMRAFIGKRYPAARRDLVLDVWEIESPSVLRAGKRCPAGELPYGFPETQWELLMSSGLDDNPFMALISYEDDIVGEVQCMRPQHELAYSLHDHLYEEGRDALYLLEDDEAAITIERRDADADGKRVWYRLNEGD